MVVPLIGRSVAAVAGALLVLTAWASAVGTLIVPRSVSSWLTRGVDRIVNGAFRLAAGAIRGYRRRDRVLARTHYALGSGGPTIDTLPDLYARWEVWVADVAESHTTYLPLVRHPGARWRVNYEQAAYALAADLHAVPALWSGERRPSTSPIPPIRPPLGRPPK